jgi:hypothetical protein
MRDCRPFSTVQRNHISDSAAGMSSPIERLTQHERDMVQQVHDAIIGDVSHDSITYIQNHTITKINELFAVLGALDQLPESVISTHESSQRNRLSAIAKAHHHRSAKYGSQATTREKQRAGRLRQMQFISRQWSSGILERYGWNEDTLGRDGVGYMWACAKAYPRFDLDFLPQANLLRFLKHCAAVSKLDSSQEADFAGSGGTFQRKDLKSLRDLGKGKPVFIYGRKVTLETASQTEREIREWTCNQSGLVDVGGALIDLRAARPKHWNSYLLEFDEEGLLVQREHSDRAEVLCKDAITSHKP